MDVRCARSTGSGNSLALVIGGPLLEALGIDAEPAFESIGGVFRLAQRTDSPDGRSTN